MKIVKMLVLPSLLLASLIVNAADAQPVAKPEHAVAQIRPIDKLKQELSLTDDQVKAIEEIQQQNRKNFMDARKVDANSESSKFFDLTPDSKEYDDAVKKMADAAAVRARSNVEKMAESRKKVYGLLNAEQKQKFLTLTKPGQRQAIQPKRKGEKPAVE
jgi:periplasmic protein CpxP/Spy